MSDNLRFRRLKSGYYSALASLLAPISVFGAYSASNTYDMQPAGYTESNAYGSAGILQYGTSKIGGIKTATVWSGSSNSLATLGPVGMTESYILGGVPTQQVGAAYGPTTATTDNAFIWSSTAASAVNINPSGFNQSYALATDGTRQVGYGQGSVTAFSFHALTWTGTAGSFVDLHPSSGFTVSYAFGVNGNQQVGYGTTPKVQGNTFDHALLWTGTAASVVDLHPAAGYTGTYAFGAAGGKQYGFAWGTATSNLNHAVSWAGTAASMVDLHPTGLGLNQSKIFSAFDTRQVGWAWTTTNQEHAVLWSGTAASAVDLHLLLPAGATKSFARSVDVYGNVSGEAYYSSVQHAVVWFAGTTYRVTAGNAAWNNTGSWLSNTVPIAGNDVQLLQSDATNRTVNYANAANPALGKLTIDAIGTGAMTLAQAQDSLTTTNEFIGFVGAGKVDQSGGTHTVTGTLTLAARAGSSGTYLLSGSGNLNAAAMTINTNGVFTQSGGTLISGGTLNAGSLTLGGSSSVGMLDAVTSGATSASLSAAGTTSVAANANAGALRVRQNSLVLHGDAVNNSGKLTIPESAPGLASGVPSGNNAMVSIVRSLSIDNDGTHFFSTLDLTNNDLIIDYTGGSSPLSTIEAMVKSGYKNGSWAGKGIISSIAATAPALYHIAVMDNALAGGKAINNFDGIDTSNHQQILVKFTWVADFNLDGLVTSDDAFAFATYYQDGATGVHHMFGDLNYDGTITTDDAFLFATAYNESLAHLPEPGTLGMLAVGAMALLRRRK